MAAHWPPLAQIAIKGGAFVNLIWTLLNLFPVLPLDGGHLMRVILEGIFGARGLSIALIASMVLGAAATIAFFIVGWFLAGALFFLLTFESFRGWRSVRDVTDRDVDEKVQNLFRRAEEMREQGHTDEALSLYEQARNSTGKGLIFAAATESAATLWADKGEQGKAYTYLKEIRKRLSPEALLLYQKLAYKNRDYDEAISSGKECFQNFPSGDIAFINALSHAAKREVRPAVGWLKCAKQEKMDGIEEALKREEFDPIRKDPLFPSLEQEFSS
ncbi:MAG: site-2 protease family protein [Candidatus Obscuribacterales bacterium]